MSKILEETINTFIEDTINEAAEEDKTEDIYRKMVDYFIKDGTPTKLEVKAYCEKEGISLIDFLDEALATLGAFLGAGRALQKGLKEEDVAIEELQMGMKVELEHTTNREISKRIALDHLAELPDYYTRLNKMEHEGEKELDENYSAIGDNDPLHLATAVHYGMDLDKTTVSAEANNVIAGLAKKSGKSEPEVERLWKKAKRIVDKDYVKKGIKKDSESYYKIVTGVTKKMVGMSK